MGKQHNIEIAEDTLRVIKQNYYVKNGERIYLDIDAPLCGVCYDRIKVFSPEKLQTIVNDEDELFEKAFCASKSCRFTLVDADSFEAARDLSHGLVMNFASAKNPGGGFLNGANAQEESLCRCSTLYASISIEEAREMYDYNKRVNLPCYSDYMLLSPDIIVFRDRTGEYLDEPFYTSVMTVAAPNVNGAAHGIPQSEIDKVIKERLRCFLMTAAHEGYRELVLGAWGCGAFGNDPYHVARCFRELFFDDGLNDFFDNVIFAILGGGENYNAFAKVFANVIENKEIQAKLTDLTFTEANKNAPVCNHSLQNVGDENLGYTFGVLADGTPFEADLWLDGNDRNISFYIPENRDFIPKVGHKHNIINESIYMTDIKCHWYSVLGIGMVERDVDDDNIELLTYIDYLIVNGIICFTTNIQNGRLGFLTDVEGNDLVCVSIALEDEGIERAKTSLHFRPFPNQPKKNKKSFHQIKPIISHTIDET